MAASLCPRFHRAIELIGGRWTGPILQILMAGPARFAALRGAIPQISDRMLSERLHELEAEGIVVRAVIPASPVRVEYALSEKGRQLQGSFEAVGRWAERWITLPNAAGGSTPKPTRSRSGAPAKTIPRRTTARSRRA